MTFKQFVDIKSNRLLDQKVKREILFPRNGKSGKMTISKSILSFFFFKTVLVILNGVKLVLEENLSKMMAVLIQKCVENLNVQRTHIAEIKEPVRSRLENVIVRKNMLELIVHWKKVKYMFHILVPNKHMRYIYLLGAQASVKWSYWYNSPLC